MTKLKTNLFLKNGSADKIYNVTLQSEGDGYIVFGENGRRGLSLKRQEKTAVPLSLEDATKIYEKLIKSKIKSGYSEGEDGVATIQATNDSESSGVNCLLLNPINESMADTYLDNDQFFLQEKFDGERRLIKINSGVVEGINRRGLFVSLPETIVNDAKKLNTTSSLLDGEQVGDKLYVFDILEFNGKDLRSEPFSNRLAVLKSVIGSVDSVTSIVLAAVACSSSDKRELYTEINNRNGEGVVFKNSLSPYAGGRPSSMGNYLKLKFYKECSVLVTGINQQRSVAMSVYDDKGVLIPVGNVTIPANQNVPEIGVILEVRYLYAYQGGSLYQPTCKFARNDIDVSDCHIGQLVYKAEAA